MVTKTKGLNSGSINTNFKMLDFAQLLEAAQTVEDKARILKYEISRRKNDVEKLNGGLVLNIEEYGGLRIGDKVRYTNALGQSSVGYLSHFFQRTQDLAQTGGRPFKRDEQKIIPVIVPVGSSGYSTHNGQGLPERL